MNSNIETAKEIRQNVLNGTLNSDNYVDFKKQYPKFYEMLRRKDMDNEMFKKMIEILSTQVVTDQKAAIKFSEFGAEKYLYPQFGKPSQSDREKANKTVNKHIKEL